MKYVLIFSFIFIFNSAGSELTAYQCLENYNQRCHQLNCVQDKKQDCGYINCLKNAKAGDRIISVLLGGCNEALKSSCNIDCSDIARVCPGTCKGVEIKALVKSVEISNSTLENIDNLPFNPVKNSCPGFNNNQNMGKVYSLEEGKALFEFIKNKSMLPYKNPNDGCFARSFLAGKMLNKCGIESEQIYIFDAEKNDTGQMQPKLKTNSKWADNGKEVQWGYHVAPTIKIMTSDGPKDYIIDPATSNSLITVDEWSKKFLQDKDVSQCSEETSYNEEKEGCFIIKADRRSYSPKTINKKFYTEDDEKRFEMYSARYANMNLQKSVKKIDRLGVKDEEELTTTEKSLLAQYKETGIVPNIKDEKPLMSWPEITCPNEVSP